MPSLLNGQVMQQSLSMFVDDDYGSGCAICSKSDIILFANRTFTGTVHSKFHK